MQIFQTNTGENVLFNKMSYKGMGAHIGNIDDIAYLSIL